MQFIGTLGKDAEIRDAANTKVINFSVAVNIGYGDKKSTMWIECAKFGEKTGIAEYLKKGTKVYISGEPALRTWEKDGKNGAAINVRVQDIELLGSQQQQQPQQVQEQAAATDLPF